MPQNRPVAREILPSKARLQLFYDVVTLRQLVAAAACVLCLAAILHSAFFSWRYFSITPFWDIWSWVGDYQSYSAGHYSYHDLLKPHNEHRIVTTRFILFADAILFQMTGRLPVIVNFCLLLLMGILIARAFRQMRLSFPSAMVSILMGAAWMSSTCQWIDLITPFQVQYSCLCVSLLCAFVFMEAAVDVNRTRRSSMTFAAASAGFLVVAFFSMAGGLLALPAAALLLVLGRARLATAAVFIMLTGLGAALFLIGYHPAHAQPETMPDSVDHLIGLSQFALQFLGNCFHAFQYVPLVAGFAGATVTIIILIVAARARIGKDTRLPSGALMLLGMSITIILIAGAGALARLDGGISGSLEPRYGPMSLAFLACVARMATLLCGLSASGSPNRAAILSPLVILPALFAIAACNLASPYETQARQYAGGMDSQGEAVRKNILIPQLFGRMIFGTVDEVTSRIAFLRLHGLSMFAPGNERRPPQRLLTSMQNSALPMCAGKIDFAYQEDSTRFVVRGWLANGAARRIADWVALKQPGTDSVGVIPLLEYRSPVRLAKLEIHDVKGFFGGAFDTSVGTGGITTVRAFGLFAGQPDLTCKYPVDLVLGPWRVQTVSSIGLTQAAAQVSPVMISSAFHENGVTSPTLLQRRYGVGPLFASAAAGDAATGKVTFTLLPMPGRDIVIPFAAGPDAAGQSLEIKFHDGSIARLELPEDSEDSVWRAATLPGATISAHGGVPIVVSATDSGTGWGQWMAIGTPLLTQLSADWAKLY